MKRRERFPAGHATAGSEKMLRLDVECHAAPAS
jgi:hypothetical protein